jgi:hypothetical protein
MKLDSLTPISADKKGERKSNMNNLSEFFPLKLTHFYLHFSTIIVIVIVVGISSGGDGGGGGDDGGGSKFESVSD